MNPKNGLNLIHTRLMLFVLAVVCVTLAFGCSKNSSNNFTRPPLTPQKQLLGSWEAVVASLDEEELIFQEDEFFWYFLDKGQICTLELRSSGDYGPDFSGIYVASETSVTITNSMGDTDKFSYSYSAEADTVFLQLLNGEEQGLRYVLFRVYDAPGNDWCSLEN